MMALDRSHESIPPPPPQKKKKKKKPKQFDLIVGSIEQKL